jgi:transposase InsO family protein
VRTAEQPGQALNVDLCFVPEQHEAQERLPAVSGSSRRMMGVRQVSEGISTWPGQVFGQKDLDYREAMLQYVAATRDRLIHTSPKRDSGVVVPSRWRLANEAQAERYQVLQQRRCEDTVWKNAKTAWRSMRQAYQVLTRQEQRKQQVIYDEARLTWKSVRLQRLETLEKRQQENQAWHQRNQKLQTSASAFATGRSWIAILVISDNCTRQCLGLPLFRSGAKVTSQEIVAALKAVLPDELAFIISDQGAHFRTQAFWSLAQEAGFIHVPVYRHRPQTNGIAERMVLTIKEWLRSKKWQSVDDLKNYLATFTLEYNNRPHQGLAIPGLSPTEFANRIWLM